MNGKEILYNAFKSKDTAKETMGRLGIIAARGVCIKTIAGLCADKSLDRAVEQFVGGNYVLFDEI